MRIEDMNTWPDKTPIQGFEAKVVNSYGRTEGEGKKGPWWRDDYNVEDEDGATIKLKHWNSPHPAPFSVGDVLLVKGAVSVYNDTRSIQGRAANIHQVGAPGDNPQPLERQAKASTPSASAPTPAGNGWTKPEPLTVDEAIALANRVRRDLSAEGWQDEQAMMAHVNTLIIGMGQGKVVAFDARTAPIPFEGESEAPAPEPPADYVAGEEYGSPEDPDGDIPF